MRKLLMVIFMTNMCICPRFKNAFEKIYQNANGKSSSNYNEFGSSIAKMIGVGASSVLIDDLLKKQKVNENTKDFSQTKMSSEQTKFENVSKANPFSQSFSKTSNQSKQSTNYSHLFKNSMVKFKIYQSPLLTQDTFAKFNKFQKMEKESIEKPNKMKPMKDELSKYKNIDLLNKPIELMTENKQNKNINAMDQKKDQEPYIKIIENHVTQKGLENHKTQILNNNDNKKRMIFKQIDNKKPPNLFKESLQIFSQDFHKTTEITKNQKPTIFEKIDLPQKSKEIIKTQKKERQKVKLLLKEKPKEVENTISKFKKCKKLRGFEHKMSSETFIKNLKSIINKKQIQLNSKSSKTDSFLTDNFDFFSTNKNQGEVFRSFLFLKSCSINQNDGFLQLSSGNQLKRKVDQIIRNRNLQILLFEKDSIITNTFFQQIEFFCDNNCSLFNLNNSLKDLTSAFYELLLSTSFDLKTDQVGTLKPVIQINLNSFKHLHTIWIQESVNIRKSMNKHTYHAHNEFFDSFNQIDKTFDKFKRKFNIEKSEHNSKYLTHSYKQHSILTTSYQLNLVFKNRFSSVSSYIIGIRRILSSELILLNMKNIETEIKEFSQDSNFFDFSLKLKTTINDFSYSQFYEINSSIFESFITSVINLENKINQNKKTNAENEHYFELMDYLNMLRVSLQLNFHKDNNGNYKEYISENFIKKNQQSRIFKNINNKFEVSELDFKTKLKSRNPKKYKILMFLELGFSIINTISSIVFNENSSKELKTKFTSFYYSIIVEKFESDNFQEEFVYFVFKENDFIELKKAFADFWKSNKQLLKQTNKSNNNKKEQIEQKIGLLKNKVEEITTYQVEMFFKRNENLFDFGNPIFVSLIFPDVEFDSKSFSFHSKYSQSILENIVIHKIKQNFAHFSNSNSKIKNYVLTKSLHLIYGLSDNTKKARNKILLKQTIDFASNLNTLFQFDNIMEGTVKFKQNQIANVVQIKSKKLREIQTNFILLKQLIYFLDTNTVQHLRKLHTFLLTGVEHEDIIMFFEDNEDRSLYLKKETTNDRIFGNKNKRRKTNKQEIMFQQKISHRYIVYPKSEAHLEEVKIEPYKSEKHLNYFESRIIEMEKKHSKKKLFMSNYKHIETQNENRNNKQIKIDDRKNDKMINANIGETGSFL